MIHQVQPRPVILAFLRGSARTPTSQTVRGSDEVRSTLCKEMGSGSCSRPDLSDAHLISMMFLLSLARARSEYVRFGDLWWVIFSGSDGQTIDDEVEVAEKR